MKHDPRVDYSYMSPEQVEQLLGRRPRRVRAHVVVLFTIVLVLLALALYVHIP